MATRRSAPDEPEPIDAEFEPASGPEPKPRKRVGPRPYRSRSATLQELLLASCLAAVLGATVAIIVSNANSSSPAGTLAREIDNLVRGQGELAARAGQSAADVVSLRSRLDAQGERLDQQDAAEATLRTELAALTAQLSAVSGAGDGSAPAGATAATSPLGVLLGRINRLESIVEEDKTAPKTTRELQRAIADLSQQVAALDLANTTLVTAFDRREAALAALETGMQTVATDLAGMRTGQPVRTTGAAPVAAPPVVLAATARSQAIRALSLLEAAARSDQPFFQEHKALTDLLPGEAGLAAMAAAARQGVPTLAQLRADFDAAANRAVRIATDESDDGWNWLRQAFGGVVEFAPAASVAANMEVIRNARRQLDIGDVRGAVEAASAVGGGAASAFRTWRDDATRRWALDEGVRDLNARLLGAAAAPVAGTAG